MRAGRLISLLLLLQARGRMTARQLASELEVSVRTVYTPGTGGLTLNPAHMNPAAVHHAVVRAAP